MLYKMYIIKLDLINLYVNIYYMNINILFYFIKFILEFYK